MSTSPPKPSSSPTSTRTTTKGWLQHPSLNQSTNQSKQEQEHVKISPFNVPAITSAILSGFGYLELIDCRKVCKGWKELIDSEEFDDVMWRDIGGKTSFFGEKHINDPDRYNDGVEWTDLELHPLLRSVEGGLNIIKNTVLSSESKPLELGEACTAFGKCNPGKIYIGSVPITAATIGIRISIGALQRLNDAKKESQMNEKKKMEEQGRYYHQPYESRERDPTMLNLAGGGEGTIAELIGTLLYCRNETPESQNYERHLARSEAVKRWLTNPDASIAFRASAETWKQYLIISLEAPGGV